MNKRELRSGFTTGACAAAAARGAALMLVQQSQVAETCITLPGGERVTFQLQNRHVTPHEAGCSVIKDAGDDPDVTNGAEIRVTVRSNSDTTQAGLTITGGIGIGTVTKPGLAVAPGEWAINPVPRRMITAEAGSVLAELLAAGRRYTIEIAIPDGEERARKTLNARLGILGGLSILGTTGIVRPISAQAWTDTLDTALDVARACGCSTVVLSTGRTSEMAAQSHLPGLAEESCIMMGDHIAYAVQACLVRGFTRPVIACQFAKLLKIACGHPNTHAAASELDLAVLHDWAAAYPLPPHLLTTIAQANTAREIAITTHFNSSLMEIVATQARRAVATHAPGICADICLCDYAGGVVRC